MDLIPFIDSGIVEGTSSYVEIAGVVYRDLNISLGMNLLNFTLWGSKFFQTLPILLALCDILYSIPLGYLEKLIKEIPLQMFLC